MSSGSSIPEVTLQHDRVRRADIRRDLAASGLQGLIARTEHDCRDSSSGQRFHTRREICTAMHADGRDRDRTYEAKKKICRLNYSGGLLSADAAINDCLPQREHRQDADGFA